MDTEFELSSADRFEGLLHKRLEPTSIITRFIRWNPPKWIAVCRRKGPGSEVVPMPKPKPSRWPLPAPPRPPSSPPNPAPPRAGHLDDFPGKNADVVVTPTIGGNSGRVLGHMNYSKTQHFPQPISNGRIPTDSETKTGLARSATLGTLPCAPTNGVIAHRSSRPQPRWGYRLFSRFSRVACPQPWVETESLWDSAKQPTT